MNRSGKGVTPSAGQHPVVHTRSAVQVTEVVSMDTPVPAGSQPMYGEDITLNEVAKINAFLAK
ncbi:hypothetical protein GCM10009566_28680 [Streptomyces murinus]